MPARDPFASSPARVYWEITRACSLACRHCRAEAAPDPAPNELDTVSGFMLLEHLACASPKPHVVFTGGDPLERDDLFLLLAKARALGLAVSVSPSGTPRLTEDVIARLRDAGVDAISIAIDCAAAARHDAIRGIPGCFERSLETARHAVRLGLPFEVDTLVSEETIDDIPAIEPLARWLGAARWTLFFLVGADRGAVLSTITTARCRELLEWIERRSTEPGMMITTAEAPPLGHATARRDMFVGHDGEIHPSGFVPISAGNVRGGNPLRIYRESPLFTARQ